MGHVGRSALLCVLLALGESFIFDDPSSLLQLTNEVNATSAQDDSSISRSMAIRHVSEQDSWDRRRPREPSVRDMALLVFDAITNVGSKPYTAPYKPYDDLFGEGVVSEIQDMEKLPASSREDIERGIYRRNATESDRMLRRMWRHDIFPDFKHRSRKDGDEGFNFFKAAPPVDWVVLCGTCVALCLLDYFVLWRVPDTFLWHIVIIFVWILVALCFNAYIWAREGHQKAFEWCSGYVLEWMLSMDNLFVFHLVFSAYSTPASQIHKAVFVGIIGAVLMRMVFFMVVSTLLHLFGWFRWPFGALLVWSGIEAARAEDDEDGDPSDTRLIRFLKWALGDRLQESYDEGARIFTWANNGKLQFTLLLVVIVCLEFTDVLFAIDSVSAKVAQIPDQYTAFSSSVMAMYGLRAMFFIIKDLVDMFDMLKYGLCLILMFIGVELMFSHWFRLASSTVCIMIISVFVICMVGSQTKKAYAKMQRKCSSDIRLDEEMAPAEPATKDESNCDVSESTSEPGDKSYRSSSEPEDKKV